MVASYPGSSRESKMAMNKEAARKSRQKKKMYVEMLENRIRTLERANGVLEVMLRSERCKVGVARSGPTAPESSGP